MKNISLFFLLFLSLRGNAQKGQNDLPVQVNVQINQGTPAKELILYGRERPLELKDFKGRPDKSSPGVAATYSGILMEMEGASENGILKIVVTLTVYFNKEKSWMKREGKDERVLAHEQHHFDLTVIKACALANAIAAGKYTAADVRDKLRALQKLHTTELEALQQAYDRETRHGTDTTEQAAWSERIEKGLVAAGCI